MLLPYNVDRPTRRIPVWTYGLLGINIFVFFITVFISNFNLPTDRAAGVTLIEKIMKGEKEKAAKTGGASAADESEEATDNAAENAADNSAEKAQRIARLSQDDDSNDEAMGPNMAQFKIRRLFRPRLYRQPASNSAENKADNEAKEESTPASDEAKQDMENMMLLMEQRQAMEIAFEKADSPQGYKEFWQIEHAYANFVGDPHYSVLNTFAYRASTPTLWSLVAAMFLHGGFMHLLGNMIYLWVFGRALEDTLGPAIYVGAYLLCGIAATLLYHVMTMTFTPASSAIPSLGASGAIAGVLGLFALRFYRTPVRIVYVLPNVLAVVFLIGIVLGVIGGIVLGLPGFLIGFFGTWVAFFIYARAWAWGTFKVASAWAIGAWLVIYNIVPGVMALTRDVKSGGTAYWAHIGGFALGMLYAALIGSKGEGALEYALEDAQKAFDGGQWEPAIERATNVLTREPNNAGAYEVIAKSYDGLSRETDALDNYEIAIGKHMQANERETAVNTYLHSLSKNPGFILDPKMQLALGSQMARMALYKEAAENLAKIPFTYPEAPEGELALLRSAQIYLEHLGEPDMAAHLLNEILVRYPETQWMQQVERGLRMAEYQMNAPDESFESAPEPEPEKINTRVQAQLPQIKR